MNRRDFLAASATIAAAYPSAFAAARAAKLRVGLIGCGWYGKCDLLRLMQVAPVEVVSLCDVDKKMLADAADIVAKRQERQEAAHLHRLQGDAEGEGPRHRRGRDAGPLARAADDRRVEAGADVYVQKPISVDVHGRQGDARRGPQAQARRAGRHAAAQHPAPRWRPATRS